MGREKALMVINMAYDLFVRKQTEYSLMNKFGDWIDVLDSGIASTGYNTQITMSFVATGRLNYGALAITLRLPCHLLLILSYENPILK
ncbi:MAG: hypothetical protein AUJ85_07195 [Elusimicrobia bacterium CG1_02_37_114]|nr:MAG: hypothetical protein AUJ85_07195 [Elusimicrobia bacterium CG1_02_37_114]